MICRRNSPQLRCWRKVRRAIELADGVIAEGASAYELAGDVKLKPLTLAPVVDSPLEQQHVGLWVFGETRSTNRLIERQSSFNQLMNG